MSGNIFTQSDGFALQLQTMGRKICRGASNKSMLVGSLWKESVHREARSTRIIDSIVAGWSERASFAFLLVRHNKLDVPYQRRISCSILAHFTNLSTLIKDDVRWIWYRETLALKRLRLESMLNAACGEEVKSARLAFASFASRMIIANFLHNLFMTHTSPTFILHSSREKRKSSSFL